MTRIHRHSGVDIQGARYNSAYTAGDKFRVYYLVYHHGLFNGLSWSSRDVTRQH